MKEENNNLHVLLQKSQDEVKVSVCLKLFKYLYNFIITYVLEMWFIKMADANVFARCNVTTRIDYKT